MSTSDEYIDRFHKDLLDRNTKLLVDIKAKGVTDIAVATKLNHLKDSLINFIRCLLSTIELKNEMIDKLNAEIDNLRK